MIDARSHHPIQNRWRAAMPVSAPGPLPTVVEQSGRGDRAFDPSLEAEFREVIGQLIARYPEYDTFYYRRMADFLYQPERVRNDFHCILPSLLFRCLSNGDVVLCSEANVVTGNLLDRKRHRCGKSAPTNRQRRDT